MRPLFKYIGIVIYILLLILVSAKLFFEKEFDAFVARIISTDTADLGTLKIAYAEPMVSLNPLTNDSGSRARLLHIYEGLVRVSPDLKIEPALAISFGSLDETTWEFRLRPGVVFHDGSSLTIESVIASITAARDARESDLKDLVASIARIEKIDDSTFHIVTKTADPLLLQKLSLVLISPEGKFDAARNIGTGQYAFSGKSETSLTLRRFETYWGSAPKFSAVELATLATKDQKIAALKDKQFDIIGNIPADTAADFYFPGFSLKTQPSLEVNFLMFNFSRGIFASPIVRKAVAAGLNREKLARLGHGFATPVNQFVGRGIFGFNPDIKGIVFSLDDARKAVEGQSALVAQLDIPSGLETFGENVRKALEEIGITLKIASTDPGALGKKILDRSSEFFFFGWRSDLGDASDFLSAVVHTATVQYGQFNGGSYSNPHVDELIEESLSTVKQEVRLQKMREAMRIITEEDVIGIPLFSPDVLYAVSSKLSWKPRVDGYILAQEVKM